MRHLFVLIAMSLMSLASLAQVCKISGSNDTVEVFSAAISSDNKSVKILVSNDSENITANVTLTAQVTYTLGNLNELKEYTGKVRSVPQKTTTLVIPIDPHGDKGTGYLPSSVTVLEIKGAKCL